MRSQSIPGKLLVLAVPLALMTGACQKLKEDKVQTRVVNVLNGLKEEGGTTGDKFNFAMLSWDDKNREADGLTQEAVYDRFTRWCQEKDVNRRIASFEVVKVDLSQEPGPLSAVVTVRVEGRTLRMRVVERQRITWID